MSTPLWRNLRAPGWWPAVRLCHSEAFKLFGRELNPPGPISEDAVKPLSSSLSYGTQWNDLVPSDEATAALRRFDAELYVAPAQVNVTTSVNTLRAIRKELTAPAERFAAKNSSLWAEALRVIGEADAGAQDHPSHGDEGGRHTHLSPAHKRRGPVASPLLEGVAECCFALILSRKYNAVPDLARSAGLLTGSSVPITQNRDSSPTHFTALLQIASCYVLSCDGDPLSLHSQAVAPLVSLLEASRSVVEGLTSKEDRRHVVQSVELLLWSLDSLFHGMRGHADANTSATVTVTASGDSLGSNAARDALVPRLFEPARESAPAWLRSGLFREFPSTLGTAGGRPTDTDGGATTQTPVSLRISVERARQAEDVEALKRLFTLARQRESVDVRWALFAGAAFAGACLIPLLQRHHRDGQAVMDVVNSMGTSLGADALAAVTLVDPSTDAPRTLRWLAEFRGEEAYAAVKRALFHFPPATLATLQMRKGDVLTGNPHANWQTALEATRVLLENGESAQWRTQLPTTLRLLSDGGRLKEFFSLVKHYDTKANGGAGNLAVAAALGQAMRRSEQWQHYREVLDLIAAAPIPSSPVEDFYLEDAALHTLYSLRNARRWEEAAAFIGLLRPVMQAPALRVFASAVNDAAAHALGDSEVPVTDVVDRLLREAHVTIEELPTELALTIELYRKGAAAVEQVDLASLAPPTRRHVQRTCAQSGLWKPILSYMRQRVASEGSTVGEQAKRGMEQPTEDVTLSLDFLKALERGKAPVEEDSLRWEAVEALLSERVWADERVVMQLFHTALWNGWLPEFGKAIHVALRRCLAGGGGEAVINVHPTAKEVAALTAFLTGGTKALSSAFVERASGTAAFQHDDAHRAGPLKHGVSHSLVGHYFTSFLARDGFTVPVASTVPRRHHRGAVARYFRVPPVCVGERHSRECEPGAKVPGAREDAGAEFFLRPYPVSSEPGVASRQIRLLTREVIVSYKPAGAVIQSVARSVLQCTDASARASYQIGYLISPASQGLFVLLSMEANPKRYVFDLSIECEVLPLASEHVALLSSKFYQRFSMEVLSVAPERSTSHSSLTRAPVRVRAQCNGVSVYSGGSVLRSLKAAANEEGWTLVEKETGAGEALHVTQVTISDLVRGTRTLVR